MGDPPGLGQTGVLPELGPNQGFGPVRAGPGTGPGTGPNRTSPGRPTWYEVHGSETM